MGTTLIHVFLSSHPEYNKKIDLIYNLAPVVFWKHELRRLPSMIDSTYEPLQVKLLNAYNISYIFKSARRWVN